jgi:hypothetical protein
MKCNHLAVVKKVVVNPFKTRQCDTFYFCRYHADQIVTESVTEAELLEPPTKEEIRQQKLCTVYV